MPEIRGYLIGSVIISVISGVCEIVSVILFFIFYFAFIKNATSIALVVLFGIIGTILFLIPIILFVNKFILTTYFLLADAIDSKEVSVSWESTVAACHKGIEATKKSKKIIDKRLAEYFGLVLLVALIMFGGFLCFGIGILFAIPVGNIAIMRYFYSISENSESMEQENNYASEENYSPIIEGTVVQEKTEESDNTNQKSNNNDFSDIN